MIAIQTSARNGNVVAATLVEESDEIMLITTGGVLIRTRVKEIREMSRSTQGVTLINLGPEEKLAGLQKIVDKDDDVDPDLDSAPDTDPASDADADPDRIESADGPLGQDPGEDETS